MQGDHLVRLCVLFETSRHLFCWISRPGLGQAACLILYLSRRWILCKQEVRCEGGHLERDGGCRLRVQVGEVIDKGIDGQAVSQDMSPIDAQDRTTRGEQSCQADGEQGSSSVWQREVFLEPGDVWISRFDNDCLGWEGSVGKDGLSFEGNIRTSQVNLHRSDKHMHCCPSQATLSTHSELGVMERVSLVVLQGYMPSRYYGPYRRDSLNRQHQFIGIESTRELEHTVHAKAGGERGRMTGDMGGARRDIRVGTAGNLDERFHKLRTLCRCEHLRGESSEERVDCRLMGA